jgi:chaperonin cofactor prefoldin
MVLDKETALKLEDTERQHVETLGKKNRDLQTRIEKLEGAISTLMTVQDKLQPVP